MPTASYLKEPDFSISDKFQPYVVPYESLLKNAATKTELWKVGADRLKNFYDQALNFDLTTAPANKIKFDFLNNAEKEINKATESDLSIGDNQSKAINILTPLFDLQNPTSRLLLKDHSLTSFYKDNINILENLKKSNSKYYNRNNEIYMLDAYNDFSNETDLSKIDEHLNNKRPYIPYYDVTSELLKLKEQCKGVDNETDTPNGYYMSEFHETGTSSSRLLGCISSGLSSAAKTQFGIDGYVNFGKNYSALKDVYMNQIKEDSDILSKKILDVDSKMKAYGDMKQTPEIQKNIELLSKYRENLIEQSSNIQKQLEEFSKGGIDFIKKNYEKLASSLYTSKILDGFANSYADYSTKTILKADTAKLAVLKMEQDWKEMLQRHEFEKENARIKFGYDYQLAFLKGEINDSPDLKYSKPLDPESQKDKENTVEGSYNKFQSKIANVSSEIIGSYNDLLNKVFKDFPHLKTMTSLLSPENISSDNLNKVNLVIDSYLTKIGGYENITDPIKKTAIQEFREKITDLGSQLQFLKKTETVLENFIDKDAQLSMIKQKKTDKNFIANIPENSTQKISLFSDPSFSFAEKQINLSGKRIKDILSGRDPEIKFRINEKNHPELLINNKIYYVREGADDMIYFKNKNNQVISSKTGSFFNDFSNNYIKNSSILNKKRDELYANSLFAIDQEYDISSGNTGDKKTESFSNEKNTLKAYVGLKNTEDVRILKTNWKGDVTVTFEPENKADIAEFLKPKDVISKLEKLTGVGNVSFLGGTTYKIKNWRNSSFNDNSIDKKTKNLELLMESLQRAMDITGETSDSFLQNSSIKGLTYRVNISKSIVNPQDYTYSIEVSNDKGSFEYIPIETPLKNKNQVIAAISTYEKMLKK